MKSFVPNKNIANVQLGRVSCKLSLANKALKSEVFLLTEELCEKACDYEVIAQQQIEHYKLIEQQKQNLHSSKKHCCALEKQLDESSQTVEGFRLELTHKTDHIQHLDQQISELQQQISTLVTNLSIKEEHIELQNKETQILRRELDETYRNLACNEEKVEILTDQCSQLQEDFSLKSKHVNLLQKEKDRLIDKLQQRHKFILSTENNKENTMCGNQMKQKKPSSRKKVLSEVSICANKHSSNHLQDSIKGPLNSQLRLLKADHAKMKQERNELKRQVAEAQESQDIIFALRQENKELLQRFRSAHAFRSKQTIR